MKTVLLTGVTGQIGSALAPLLQAEGYRVIYLIRSYEGKNAKTRLAEVLPNVREGMDIAISSDITYEKAGMYPEEIEFWAGKIDVILHAAAAISFEDAEAEKTRLTNLQGTRNMLDLAKDLLVTDFHYISTAYVSGSARVFSETDLDVGQASFNAYEVSKIEAEKMVRGWNGGKHSIHRLSIVLGNSKTGEVRTFHSYYGFFIPFWRLLNSFKRKWEQDKDDCVKNGVSFNEEGILQLPLFLDCSPTAVLNLTTSDWVTENIVKLIGIQSDNKTYHLVNLDPPKVKWVIQVSLKHLGISGIVYDEEPKESTPLLKRMQKGIDGSINKYRQYIKHGTIFTSENLVQTLGENYRPQPEINEECLIRMLDYAKRVNFGDKK